MSLGDPVQAKMVHYPLAFKKPSGTSRGVLTSKDSWLIYLTQGDRWGLGECSLIQDLSPDPMSGFVDQLRWVESHASMGFETVYQQLSQYPSIRFGWEQAWQSLHAQNPMHLFPSSFTRGEVPININGLVWMGPIDQMRQEFSDKINQGFKAVKFKVGALDFASELNLIREVRALYPEDQVGIRLDANGGFPPHQALHYLEQLSPLGIHSIEQPVSPKYRKLLGELCAQSPIPIALDESLIGLEQPGERDELLDEVSPQYLILKPSLIGGFRSAQDWISRAEQRGIQWWVTSALESNIGLNAIAQWTFTQQSKLLQGLGTGGLFTNNIEGPLTVDHGRLWYDTNKEWSPIPQL